MKVTTIELRKLIPNEGKVLTNGTVYNDSAIYLGCNDSEENWYEISVEAYKEILEIERKKAEEEMNENIY